MKGFLIKLMAKLGFYRPPIELPDVVLVGTKDSPRVVTQAEIISLFTDEAGNHWCEWVEGIKHDVKNEKPVSTNFFKDRREAVK